ncbi:MAG: hypothetical protein K0Q81_2253, partial [Paenibacillus sp.]|nr:hypothetical protein [Paenibacillus sp.]
NWFYRMLFSYMPVFLAVCLTLLLILFLTVRQLSEQSSIQSNETVAKNAAQMIEQSLRSIDDGMAQFFNKDTIAGYYNEPDDNLYYSSYEAARTLTDFQIRFPLIESLYLVKPEDGSVLEPNSIYNLSNHPDKAYIENKMKSDSRFVWGDNRTVESPGYATGSRDVISLARISSLRTNGLFVAQINIATLQRLLSQSVDTTTGYLKIIDNEGQIIGSTIAMAEDGKERRKLAAVKMGYTGWVMESGVLQPGMLGWAEPVLYVSISLGGVCIFFGLVWFVIATRRHYRPVQSLLTQIGTFSIAKPNDPLHEGKKDEFQTIGRALDNLWDHSNQLQQENAKNLKFKREHQFRRLAEGRFETASFYGAKEEEMFGLQLEKRPTAILIEMDRFFSELSNLYLEHEIGLMKEAFQSSLDKRLIEEGISSTTEWLAEHQLGAIVMQEEGPEAEELLVRLLEDFRMWTEQELPFTVTISVGVAVERIEAVSVSFQTARRALTFKVSLGLNRMITQNVLPDSEQNGMVQELQRIEEISRSLRVGERNWVQELELFITALQNGSFNGEQVRNLLFVLLFHVQHKMSDLPAELEGLWLNANSRLEMTMNKGETLSDIRLILKETLESVSGRIQEWRDSKNTRVIMQDVKRYIDEHYNDPNLSQSMLAEAFRLHPSSISRLFKEEYGVKFVDYVNSVRVEHAARLMGEGHSAVQDVAEQVGFVHSKTFISIFKKITGYTPGSYQKDRTGTES